jgi:hypothetical protein
MPSARLIGDATGTRSGGVGPLAQPDAEPERVNGVETGGV